MAARSLLLRWRRWRAGVGRREESCAFMRLAELRHHSVRKTRRHETHRRVWLQLHDHRVQEDAVRRLRERLVHREEGAALLLALIFLITLGIFVPAILAMADSNIRFFAVAKGTDNRIFAADYGIEYGIRELESSTTACLNAAAGTQSLPDPPALNG